MITMTEETRARFRGALALSRELGKESRYSMYRCVNTLNRLKGTHELRLFPDFVDHSFCFVVVKQTEEGEKVSWHGGMILHGFQNTLAVEISASNYPHWSIHT